MSLQRIRLSAGLVLLMLSVCNAFAQPAEGAEDYTQLMKDGYYIDALKSIDKQIDEYTSTHVADKEVPANFISFTALEEKQNINALFQKREIPVNFTEENPQMRRLHFDAGVCHEKSGNYLEALGHYNQTFLFKRIVPEEDAEVFYRISQVYQTMGHDSARLNELEIAHYLKPDEAVYIKELADGYYTRKEIKISIFYYEKYIDNMGDSLDDQTVYIKLANLNTNLEKYLETEKYYLLYLKKNPDDLDVQYALGTLAYRNTGHFDLALENFSRIKKGSKDLAQDKLAKINELAGDIFFKREKYNRAVEAYLAAIDIETAYRQKVEEKRSEIQKLEQQINERKAELLKKNDYVKYEEYQDMLQDKTRLSYDLMMMEYELRKYNPGKLRWQIAESYERMKDYEKSLDFYRKSIAENYRQNNARDRMTKIQLLLQRGY